MLQWTDLAVRVMTTERVSGLFVVAPFFLLGPPGAREPEWTGHLGITHDGRIR